jgi:hypothetical protein
MRPPTVLVRALRALSLTLIVGTFTVQGAVIDFDDVVGSHGAPFAPYLEDGFTITPDSSVWTVNRNYGNPAPFVQYTRQATEPELVSGLFIDVGGGDFTFGSVDVYSSVTPIPYRIRGYQDTLVVFDLTGTVPNTFGAFATIFNPNAGDLLDTLYIQLVNPFVACCANPVGIDNIVVSQVNAVPEPATGALLLIAVAMLAGTASARRGWVAAPRAACANAALSVRATVALSEESAVPAGQAIQSKARAGQLRDAAQWSED